MDKKKFESKLRKVLNLMWELIPEAEKKFHDNPFYKEGARAVENYFNKNTTDTANEACSALKALEGEGLQAEKITVGQELNEGPPPFLFIFVSALKDLLLIACKNECMDDNECEEKIQKVLREFESCRTLV